MLDKLFNQVYKVPERTRSEYELKDAKASYIQPISFKRPPKGSFSLFNRFHRKKG